jgi:hypothetical protein
LLKLEQACPKDHTQLHLVLWQDVLKNAIFELVELNEEVKEEAKVM